MLSIEKYVLPSAEQWQIIIEGMRNPMNSWDKMDSEAYWDGDNWDYSIGENDFALMQKLANGGSVHAKYRRMIPVFVTLTAPLYWWKEFDTYKVGTVANSCSTMHKIHIKIFTLDDFSHEHLFAANSKSDAGIDMLGKIIAMLNVCRECYLKTKDKKYWWQIIQLLPASYNQKRTVKLNYEVLANIYRWRKDHKLDEWHTFCKWIESLPFSKLITGGQENADSGI